MAKKKARRRRSSKTTNALGPIAEQLRPLAKPLEEFHLDPRNARTHDAANLGAIEGSLQKYGQLKPIVVDLTGKVIAGNGTLQAATRLGWSHLAAVTVEMDDNQATGFAIADNRAAELADWDQSLLDELIPQLRDEEPDLSDALLLSELLPDPPVRHAETNGDGHGGATTAASGSAPLTLWKRKRLIKGDVLDFGCGKADHGFARYDAISEPAPGPLVREWDTILLHYVLNGQPADHLIIQLLALLRWMVHPDGRVLIACSHNVDAHRMVKTDDQWQALIAQIFTVKRVADKDFFAYVATR